MGTKNCKLTSTAEPFSTPTTVGRTDCHSNERCWVQDYLLVWLDANVTTSNEGSQHTLQQLRNVVNDVNFFIEPEECVRFLEGIQYERVFLVVSGALARDLVPSIHSMAQIAAIYIYCEDKSQHGEWVKEWHKVNGVYTQIKPICEALEGAMKRYDQNSLTLSFAQISEEDASNKIINPLKPSFMYTQLFKKTLLDIEHDREKAVRSLVNYCQKKYAGNSDQLKLIGEFDHDYRPDHPIWWYTRASFTNQMLHGALRWLEADNLVNIAFFIRDLHHRIQQLHNEQVGRYGAKSFLVYRGQVLSITDFEKLKKSQRGSMSFNCFLSTSTNKEVSVLFAQTNTMEVDTVGILFVMEIDPNISSVNFADIQSSGQFNEEAEILFSIPTVFRVGSVRPMHGESRLFEVNLILANDGDMELTALTDQSNNDQKELDGWTRMIRLLTDVGQPDKAEELCHALLEQSLDPADQHRYWNHLGDIKNHQGEYSKALHSYERALEIQQKSLPADHPSLPTSYSNIGMVYYNIGNYSKALFYYEQALEIKQKHLPDNHPNLATTYNNIGLMYYNMGEYSKALPYYEKDLEISQKSLPENHPDLATSYNNIGLVYNSMGDYSRALSTHERALKIQRKSLPTDHLSLATSYNNIGAVYNSMGEYSRALFTHERALEIRQKSLPDNHPDLATSYNNIGSLYNSTGEYSKALPSYERALEMRQKSLPENHPDLLSVSESVETLKLQLNNN